MSLLAMSLELRFCASRKGGTGGGGKVSTLSPGNMATSGRSCRKLLVSTGCAISLFLCMNGLIKWSSDHEAILSPSRGDHWPTAVTIASLLDSGCGLSQECAQDGCIGTCMKLEASVPT